MKRQKEEKCAPLSYKLCVGALIGGFIIWNCSLTVQMNGIRKSLAELRAESGLQSAPAETTPSATGASSTPQAKTPAPAAVLPGTGIPSAISFVALSSPLLTPRADISITLTRVTKLDDGGVALSITATAAQAQNYTVLEPKALFSIIDGETAVYPAEVSQGFDSIAPQSSVSGTVTFGPSRFGNVIILKIDSESGSMYYEFNFATKTYREALLG